MALQCRARSVAAASPVAANVARERSTLVAFPEVPSAPPEPTLPVTPSHRQIRGVLAPLAERVRTCVPGLHGSAPLTLVVVSDGSVVEAHVRGPLESTRAATCIQDIVMNLRFPPFTQERLAVAWAVPLNALEPFMGRR